MTDFGNADGELSGAARSLIITLTQTVLGSSHYLQAYALVRLHLIHASAGELGAGKSGGGFSIYSPLPVADDAPNAEEGPPRAETLLAILRRLRDRGYEVRLPFSAVLIRQLDYFQAAAEFGAGAVDAAVHGKLLEIRWISSISPEDPPSFARAGRQDRAPGQFIAPQLVPMTPVVGAAIRAGAIRLDWLCLIRQCSKRRIRRPRALLDRSCSAIDLSHDLACCTRCCITPLAQPNVARAENVPLSISPLRPRQSQMQLR